MTEPTAPTPPPDAASPPPAEDHGFSIHTSHRAILLLPLCIYVGLVVIVALLPALDWSRRYPPSKRPAPTELVRQGEQVFISQGCTVCHTQQIRGDERSRLQQGDRLVIPVLPPDARFGADEPTLPEHYADSSPPLLGTQRTGPDLTGVGDRLPSVSWHYWHLYDPRSVSPDSVMPSYRFLFRVTDDPDFICPEPEPPSWVLLLGIILGLALLFGLVGWMLFGFSSSMVLALALGVGAGLLVARDCRECEAPPEKCEVVKDTIDALGLAPNQRLVASPKARALAEYLLSLRRPAKSP